jgi:hypothetical protein
VVGEPSERKQHDEFMLYTGTKNRGAIGFESEAINTRAYSATDGT